MPKIKLLLILSTCLIFSFQVDAQQCHFDELDLKYHSFEIIKEETTTRHFRYERKQWQINLNEQDQKLNYRFDLLKSKRSSPERPIIVLMPTINGVGFLEKQLSRYLAHRGYDILIPHARKEVHDFDKNITFQMDRELSRALCGIELALDHLKSKDRWRGSEVSIIGASQGAIRGAALFSRLPEAKSYIGSVGGADLAKIYAQSTQTDISEFRERLIQKLSRKGVQNPKDLYQYLQENLQLGPYIMLQSSPNRVEDVKLFLSNRDDVVPSQTQWKLWEALNRPGQISTLSLNHAQSVLWMHFKRRAIRKFLDERMK